MRAVIRRRPVARRQTKYVFVTGGVLSGVGKGITAASLAKILKSRGMNVNIQKCDPYLNTDAGTLNPTEHGEVFVTADGAETDLDLGHYERFLDQELDQKSSLMIGRVLSRVINDERAGEYLGKTVQIIPHITDAIQDEIAAAGEGQDVHFVEIGGTVGDYESLSSLEAIREFRQRVGPENVRYIHVVYLPYIEASKEIKTKPAQNAVRNLRSFGVTPDILIARSEQEANHAVWHKLRMYADIEAEAISVVPTVDSVYQVPFRLQTVADTLTEKLDLKPGKTDLRSWHTLVERATRDDVPTVHIGVVAKYMAHEDTYKSVFEAIKAACWHHGVKADITWLDAERLGRRLDKRSLRHIDGIIIPGGFGARGIEGKIKAAQCAMDNQIPYLGLCLGMQVGVIALSRKTLNGGANSTEFDPHTPHPVISLLSSQRETEDMGGTMRLGDYQCLISKDSLARGLYQTDRIRERHRHRYEFNNDYREPLQQAGLVLSGVSPDNELVEMVELADHPFFVGSQFHPEFTSRPQRPNPLFCGFIEAAARRTEKKE
jgi:CTP synthase